MREKKTALLLLLLTIPVVLVPAQLDTLTSETNTRPKWVRDLRRWEIVTFGSIPFAMFFTRFAMDMVRWSNANGMDMSSEGRQYAPWPLKSAGAIPMNSREVEKVLVIAASAAVTIGLTDLLIVQTKRKRAQRRAESLPVGSSIITRSPWDSSVIIYLPGDEEAEPAPEPAPEP